MQRRIVALSAIVAVSLGAGAAAADPLSRGFEINVPAGAVALGVAVIAADLTLLATAIAAAAKNGAAIAERRQASSGWHAAGYVLGGITLGVGVLTTVLASRALAEAPASSEHAGSRVLLAAGLGHLALGAASIALTAVSERYRDAAPGRALSVAPYVAPTDRGEAQYGLALAGRF